MVIQRYQPPVLKKVPVNQASSTLRLTYQMGNDVMTPAKAPTKPATVPTAVSNQSIPHGSVKRRCRATMSNGTSHTQ